MTVGPGPPCLKGAWEQKQKWGTPCREAASMSLDDFYPSETKKARSSCLRRAPRGLIKPVHEVHREGSGEATHTM